MKKTLAILLCIAMVLCVCGCSTGDTASNTSSDEIEYIEVIVDDNSSTTSTPTTSSKPDVSSQQQENSSIVTPVESQQPDQSETPSVTETVIDYNTVIEVDICDDVIRGYLSATTSAKQYFWLSEYSGGRYDYQTVDLDWDYDGSDEFTFTISENADFSNSYSFVTRSRTITSTLFVPGKTYYWNVKGNISDKPIGGGKIKIKDAPVRWIQIDGTGNVRDMGGWTTESGKKVKYEMLYRGQALDKVTEAGKNTIKQLGFKTEIDIRSTGNDRTPPSIPGMKYEFLSTTMQYDGIFSTNENSKAETINNYKRIFELISDEKNYPIFTHCSAGADRTGTYAFILNGLLGVSYEDLTRDFELTSFSSSGKRWRGNGDGNTFSPNDLEMKVEGNYVAWGVLYKEMMEKYGTSDGKLSTAIERYLINYVGVPKSQIDSFKSIMLG